MTNLEGKIVLQSYGIPCALAIFSSKFFVFCAAKLIALFMDCSKRPKIELHLHLDCSLSYAVAKRLSPGLSREMYDQAFIAPARCLNLADYLKRAVKGFELMQSPEALRLVTLDLLAQLRADRVVYAEIRFAPLLHTQGGLSGTEVVASVLAALEEGAGPDLTVGLILCTLRRFSGAQSLETAALACTYHGQGVVGFDIAGDEASYPLAPHVPAFLHAHEHGLPATAHAGEAKGAESVEESLDQLHIRRVGHGVRSVEAPQTVQRLKALGIHLELCPTSNLQTNIYATLKAHPIQALFQSGHSISINTDGRTLSNVTLTEEYEQLQQAFGWGRAELLACNLHALEAAFLDEGGKQRLREVLKRGWAE